MPPRRTHVCSLGLSLDGSRAPFWGPFLFKRSQFSEVICSGSGGCSRRVSASPTLKSPIPRGDLLRLGSCLALGLRPRWAKMSLELGMYAYFRESHISLFGAVFAKSARRRYEKPLFGLWASLLVALGPLRVGGSSGAQKEVMLNPALVSQSGVLTRRKQPPEPEQSTSDNWPLEGVRGRKRTPTQR